MAVVAVALQAVTDASRGNTYVTMIHASPAVLILQLTIGCVLDNTVGRAFATALILLVLWR